MNMLSLPSDPTAYWAAVGAIAQILAAIGTVLAIWAALWIALSERREAIKLDVEEKVIVGEAVNATHVIAFEVVNVGHRAVRITNMGLRTGWMRRGPKSLVFRQAVLMTIDLPYSATIPFNLEPGERKAVYQLAEGYNKTKESFVEIFNNRILFFGRPVRPKVMGWVTTTLGTTVYTRIGAGFRKRLDGEFGESHTP